jgi:hypothetical protein
LLPSIHPSQHRLDAEPDGDGDAGVGDGHDGLDAEAAGLVAPKQVIKP